MFITSKKHRDLTNDKQTRSEILHTNEIRVTHTLKQEISHYYERVCAVLLRNSSSSQVVRLTESAT